MKSTIKLVFYVIFVAYCNIQAQNISNGLNQKNFYIYLQQNRYDTKVSNLVYGNSNFKYYKYLANYYIDREKKGVINYIYVDEGLNKLYPNKYESGFLCLNLENKIYQNVKNFKSGQVQFENSIDLLKGLIKYVKTKRPNLMVGIYGMPFNYYYDIQKKVGESNKLDELLREVDYISPHLYIYYPDKQKGKEANIGYFKKNLKVALEYGKRLNKPVIPYVWYLIHPSNKKYGNELIGKKEMVNYLNTIKNYVYLNQSVNGIIWWEPGITSYKFPKELNVIQRKNMTKDEIFVEYTESLSKSQ